VKTVPFSSLRSGLAVAFLILAGHAAQAGAVKLLPQEQAIATDMITDPDQGRPYMVLDPIIQKVAEARAQDMGQRNYFSHVNPDGFAANYLLQQAGYQLPAWWGSSPTANYVESIAAGSSDPSTIWNAWMASPPHKQDLLGQVSFFASETHYGVGYYFDATSTYQFYWVVITAPPEPIEIMSPQPSANVTGATVTISGLADPTTNPASVQYCVVNASGTSAYQTATGVGSWTGTVTDLVPGSNVIRAQSLDSNGKVIAQTSCRVNDGAAGTLAVTVSGSGSVTAALSGTTTQLVGSTLTVKATPEPGYLFAGWTGSITSGSAALSFTMQAGVNLQANFQPSPYLAASGAYYGLVTSGSETTTAGLARVTVSAYGLFTGKVTISGTAFSFTGQLNSDGYGTATVDGVTITVQADLTGETGDITGTATVGGVDYGFTVNESTFNAKTNAAPQAGRYTLVLAPDPSETGTSTPQGSGYATIVVAPNGTAMVAGRLADGTPYATTGHIANDGTLSLYCVPSGVPAGWSLNGVLTFESTDASDIDGTLTWTKGANAKDAFYPGGFTTQLPTVGSHYVRPGTGLQALDAAPGMATAGLGSGNLSQPLSVPVVVSQQDKATMATPGSPDVTLNINPVSGAVTGSFVMPDGSLKRGIRGVVFQKQQSAYGYFRGVNQCGYFSLTQGS